MRFAITFLLLSALPIFARAKEKTIITCQVNEVGLTLGGNSGEQKGPADLRSLHVKSGDPKKPLEVEDQGLFDGMDNYLQSHKNEPETIELDFATGQLVSWKGRYEHSKYDLKDYHGHFLRV